MTTRSKAFMMAAMLPLLLSVGCSKVQSRAAFKEGNKLYKEENYRKAIDEYKNSIAREASAEAYFYLGSSQQNLYRPGRSDAENKQMLDDAVVNYKKALELVQPGNEEHTKIKVNALGALTGIYSEDPYQDFEQALAYAQELTKGNPDDVKNLYAIANLYEKFGRIDEAEATYKKIAEMNAQDAKACGALATFYNKTLWDADGKVWTKDSKKDKKSRFRDAIGTLERCAEIPQPEPKEQAQSLFKVATFYWDKAYRDPSLSDKDKSEFADKGLAYVDRALALKPDYWEAVIYKGLLKRVKAMVATSKPERDRLIEEAAKLQAFATQLRKDQQAEAKDLPPEAQTEGGTTETK